MVHWGSGEWNFRRAVNSEEFKCGATALVLDGLRGWGAWGLRDMNPGGCRKEVSGTSRRPDSGRQLREGVGVQWAPGHPGGSWWPCAVRGMRWETLYTHDTTGCGVLLPPPTVYLQVDWGAQRRTHVSRISSSVGAARQWSRHGCVHTALAIFLFQTESWLGITEWLKIPSFSTLLPPNKAF